MSKYLKTLANNVLSKPYDDTLDNLVLYDLKKRNPIEDNYKKSEIRLALNQSKYDRIVNLRMIRKRLLKAYKKQLAYVGLPTVSLVLSVYFFFNPGKIVEEKADIIKESTIDFNEENITSIEEVEKLHVKNGIIIDSEIPTIDEFDSKFRVRFGNKGDSEVISFTINEDGEWKRNELSRGTFYKNEESEAIREVDDGIKEYINIAYNYAQNHFNEHYNEIVEKAMKSDENDILATLTTYEKVGEEIVNVKYFRLWFFMLVFGLDIISTLLLLDLFKDKKYIMRSIMNQDGHLDLINFNKVNFLVAPLEYKREFIVAEENRIRNLYEELNKYEVTDEFMSKYEKKLMIKPNNKGD